MRVVATLVIVYLLVTLRTETSGMSTIGMGLLIGGAAGNLIDRLFRGDDGILQGAVVDFIDFQWFPIFNVADMAVNVGAGLLILNSILSARAHRHDANEQEPDRLDRAANGTAGRGADRAADRAADSATDGGVG